MTINWRSNKDEDDFTARVGDYVLRVEQMDRYYWWWCIYHEDRQISDGFTQTKEQAFTIISNHLLPHLQD